MIFGNTKLLEQYERRIAEQSSHYEARIMELKSQISGLEKLVFSQTSAHNIPLVALEADSIISQREETVKITEEELNKLREVESECDRILAGNY